MYTMPVFLPLVRDNRIDPVAESRLWPDTAALSSFQQGQIQNAGIQVDASGDAAAQCAAPIEYPSFAITVKVGRAILVFGNAKLLHAQRTVFVESVSPAVREGLGMVSWVCWRTFHLQDISHRLSTHSRPRDADRTLRF